MLAVPVDQARGHTGSLVECLGPAGSGLDTASITGLANTVVFERLTQQALADTSLTWEAAESGSGARVFRATLGEFEAELSVGDVARAALLYCRTPAEAATLEAQRLVLKLSTSALTQQMLTQAAAATVAGATA